jgi:hypothetical protein
VSSVPLDQVAWFVLAICGCAIVGAGWGWNLIRDDWFFRRALCAFWFGALLVGGLSLALNAAGWKLDRTLAQTVLAMTVVPAVIQYRFLKQRVPTEPDKRARQTTRLKMISVAFSIVAVIYFGYLFYVLMATSMEYSPAIGVWGYKAKLFYLTGVVSPEYIVDPTKYFAQPSYPLGYPMLVVWCYMWMGHADDYLVQCLPFLFYGLTFSVVAGWIVRQGNRIAAVPSRVPSKARRDIQAHHVALIVLLAVYVSPYPTRIMANFYIAGAVWLVSVVAASLLMECGLQHQDEYDSVPAHSNAKIWCAMLMLGSLAWIKNEGAIVFFVGVLAFWVASGRLTWVPALVSALVFIVPWRLFAWSIGAEAWDYDLHKPLEVGMSKNIHTLTATWTHFGKIAFVNFTDYGMVWCLLPVLLLVRWRRVVEDRRIIFLLMWMMGLLLVFTSVFLFSTRPLEWHLLALNRLIMLPTLFGVMVVCLLLMDSTTESRQHGGG